jgi:hypothetical protein
VRITIYRTVIFPVVLYWCEIWPIKEREEHRLSVCVRKRENTVLRNIFGAKRNEVTWKRNTLQGKKPHDWYSSNTVRVIRSRRMRWEGHVSRMGRGEERCMQGYGGET